MTEFYSNVNKYLKIAILLKVLSLHKNCRFHPLFFFLHQNILICRMLTNSLHSIHLY